MSAPTPPSLLARHIVDASANSTLEPHWGYAARVLPCTADAGSCAYLDVVYSAHDRGMLYTAALWGTFAAVILALGVRHAVERERNAARLLAGRAPRTGNKGAMQRAATAITVGARRAFLPETLGRRVFGRTTRLQVTLLGVLCAYLLLWTFLGYPFKRWITPVKAHPGLYNVRSSLGPFADRVGVLAYALTPLSILLSARESVLSYLTGIPGARFLFLHRWLGYVMLAQAVLHTVGWTLIEARLYQPQPSVGREWIKQAYMIWGVVALAAFLLLALGSTRWAIKRTGYEAFRKAHYALALLYLVACWGHWKQLRCFILPSILLWALDRAARLVRTALLHYNVLPPQQGANGAPRFGFQAFDASATLFPGVESGDSTGSGDSDGDGAVVRLDFAAGAHSGWAVGQHFYLTFVSDGSLWQAHPLTPLAYPLPIAGEVRHAYVFRAQKGETRRIAQAVRDKIEARRQDEKEGEPSASTTASTSANTASTRVVLTGPYGVSVVDGLLAAAPAPAPLSRSLSAPLTPATNVLCVAGGTGITFVLPVLLHLARAARAAAGVAGEKHAAPAAMQQQYHRAVKLVWVVRRARDAAWVQPELDALRAVGACEIQVFVTREHQQQQQEQEQQEHAQAVSSEQASADSAEYAEGRNEKADTGADSSDAAGAASLPSLARVPTSSAGTRHRRPSMSGVLRAFLSSVAEGGTTVFASGPGRMVSELRAAVARANEPRAVWRGDERADVRLVCDDRGEW